MVAARTLMRLILLVVAGLCALDALYWVFHQNDLNVVFFLVAGVVLLLCARSLPDEQA